MSQFAGARPRGSVVAMRDRLVELRRVPAGELRPNPGNWVAVSGYHGDWPQLAASWHRIEWTARTGSMGHAGTLRTEVLWMSYEPDHDRLAAVGVERVEAPT